MSLSSLTLALERRAYAALSAQADRREAGRAQRLGRLPKPSHLLTGERGEDAAFFHLRSLGYTIVARRWRSERMPGDLDLVAWDGPTLVIFEIKTRTAHDFAPAAAEVDQHKQRILRRMASAYLRQIPEPNRASVQLRFDILSVYLLPTGTEFEHIREAFSRFPPRITRWR